MEDDVHVLKMFYKKLLEEYTEKTEQAIGKKEKEFGPMQQERLGQILCFKDSALRKRPN